ncbi:response regulator [Paenibacillus lutimineralis]|uniref:Response regulator n=1 Tax=Paenibacillus lutimineralis TaxID=2707005 RepID=A0A3S9UT47_9BACL|nr:response regulator [Paenibacillus lutimineralis]AZS13499.1 response regulator [Paenibacillus lutimineralis]
MYHLLIVDDLPIIVDGLLELFEQTSHLELKLYKAYSGEEALEILKAHSIDIVISDIKMPGLEGIELLQEIRRHWPSCKVIFLSAYNDFQYARSAITYGGFEYILKIESDDKIIHSVERAIAKLEEEAKEKAIVAKAQADMRIAMPSLQKEAVLELLKGRQLSTKQLRHMLEEVRIPLEAELPVYMMLGRIEEWKQGLSVQDRALYIYAFKNISDEYLSSHVCSYSCCYDQNRIVWLIQPVREDISGGAEPFMDWMRAHREAKRLIHVIQQSCERVLGLSASFVLNNRSTSWNELSPCFHTLKYDFATQREGIRDIESAVFAVTTDNDEVRTQTQSYDPFYHTRVQLLMTCLENNHQEQFSELYLELVSIWKEDTGSYERKIELYHSLSAVYLFYLSKHPEVREYLNTLLDLDQLFHPQHQGSWEELDHYFWQLAEYIFEWIASREEDTPAEVVAKVHQYIERNIAADTSLNALADYVGLNPSYLSRLYKQITGEGLSKYINDYRTLAAKSMLLNSSKKVGEIAAALGYNSALAFIRFFKRQSGMTPQEFRMLGSEIQQQSQ